MKNESFLVGQGVNEKGIIKSCQNQDYQLKIGSEVVVVDKRYFRPTEVDLLIGDPTKANTKLGWKPKYKLVELVNDMMESDLKLMKKDKFLQDNDYNTHRYFE